MRIISDIKPVFKAIVCTAVLSTGFLFSQPLSASGLSSSVAKETFIDNPYTSTTDSLTSAPNSSERESIFPKSSRSLAFSHFTWGGEIGGSIDMTGNDLSTVDVDIVLGYKNRFIRTLGIGAGIHRAIGTGNNFIPVYLVFRSSFRSKPSLLFLNLKIGYSFNTISDSPTFGDTSSSLGCGINLAMSSRFQSHIILSVNHRHLDSRHNLNLPVQDIFLANLCFGVNF